MSLELAVSKITEEGELKRIQCYSNQELNGGDELQARMMFLNDKSQKDLHVMIEVKKIESEPEGKMFKVDMLANYGRVN